jgi:hypothetical protein
VRDSTFISDCVVYWPERRRTNERTNVKGFFFSSCVLVLMFIDRRGFNGVNGQSSSSREEMLDVAARTLAGGGINMVQGRP